MIGRLGDPAGMQGLSYAHLYSERICFAVGPGNPFLARSEIGALPDWPEIYPPGDATIRPLVGRLLIANGVGELADRIEAVTSAFGRVLARRSDAAWIISAGVAALDLADRILVALPCDTNLTLGPIGLTSRAEEVPWPPARLFHRVLAEMVTGPQLR